MCSSTELRHDRKCLLTSAQRAFRLESEFHSISWQLQAQYFVPDLFKHVGGFRSYCVEAAAEICFRSFTRTEKRGLLAVNGYFS